LAAQSACLLADAIADEDEVDNTQKAVVDAVDVHIWSTLRVSRLLRTEGGA
jgi:hypothetical protein